MMISTLFILLPLALSTTTQEKERLIRLREKVESGHIAYKLTEPAEIKILLGAPQSETTRKDGGMLLLEISYPEVEVIFGKFGGDASAPFTIRWLSISGENIDIGQNRKLVLRNNKELKKLDHFWGFQDVSLKSLNLKEEAELLDSMTFDTLTEWPPEDKLPSGFDPGKLLTTGKNPGLCLRELHQQGITGKEVGIAIIDQPLLLGHEEYTSRLVRYDATGLVGMPPQMHGSPVASIAVGQNIGVAPEATLNYFAVPMWENDNIHYIHSLRRIVALNADLPRAERIRVCSISIGGFAARPGFKEWQKVLRKAEELGILVVTCDQSPLNYGTLILIEGRDPDDPESYRVGRYINEHNVLRVPAGNKTVASHRGINVYTYEREGGMSWAAPYIAGLAALAFQINNNLQPQTIVEHLVKSVTYTDAGPVINPQSLIKRVKQLI